MKTKVVCLVGLLLVVSPALGSLIWVGDNFRNVNPLQEAKDNLTPPGGAPWTVTPAVGQTVLQIALGLDRACRGGLGHSAFFDNVQVIDENGTPVWSDGFEAGLGNWTQFNPSGDGTTLFAATGSYSSGQGTVNPTKGQMMAQVYKDNDGLAYIESIGVHVTPGVQYLITVDVGGLGMWDNCGFRWNKWGYELTPEPTSAMLLLALGGLGLLRRRGA